jgi:hypothetical protein
MIAFHRFLIATGILFCLGFAVWSFLAFEARGGIATLVLGAVFLLGAVGLGYYLNHLGRFLKL